jgi:hypothetical protein
MTFKLLLSVLCKLIKLRAFKLTHLTGFEGPGFVATSPASKIFINLPTKYIQVVKKIITVV